MNAELADEILSRLLLKSTNGVTLQDLSKLVNFPTNEVEKTILQINERHPAFIEIYYREEKYYLLRNKNVREVQYFLKLGGFTEEIRLRDSKKGRNDAPKNRSTAWHEKLWVRIVAIGIIAALISDALNIFDRILQRNPPSDRALISTRPKSIFYNIYRSTSEVHEQLEILIESANFTGTIDDTVKIDSVICLDKNYLSATPMWNLQDYRIKNIEISNKILSANNATSKIEIDVDFFLFYNISMQYFLSLPENTQVHLYDIHVRIPITSPENITQFKPTIVPIYIMN